MYRGLFVHTGALWNHNAPKLVLARCMPCLATPLLDFHFYMPLNLPTCVYTTQEANLYSVHTIEGSTGLSAPQMGCHMEHFCCNSSSSLYNRCPLYCYERTKRVPRVRLWDLNPWAYWLQPWGLALKPSATTDSENYHICSGHGEGDMLQIREQRLCVTEPICPCVILWDFSSFLWETYRSRNFVDILTF